MCKFHRKTPVLESLFNKAAGLKACLTQVFFCEICENFKSTYYEQHLRTTPFNTFAFKDCFGKIILHACSYVWSILKDYIKICGWVYVCWTAIDEKRLAKFKQIKEAFWILMSWTHCFRYSISMNAPKSETPETSEMIKQWKQMRNKNKGESPLSQRKRSTH